MKITERMLEDWLSKHSEEFEGFDLIILGRQVRLPNGYVDLLAFSKEGGIMPIELKVGKLKEADVGQVLRYAGDLKDFMFDLYWQVTPPHHAVDKSMVEEMAMKHCLRRMAMTPGFSRGGITPVLVGSDVDQKTIAACHGADIQLYIWQERLSPDCLFHVTDTGVSGKHNPPDELRDISSVIWSLSLADAREEFDNKIFGMIEEMAETQ